MCFMVIFNWHVLNVHFLLLIFWIVILKFIFWIGFFLVIFWMVILFNDCVWICKQQDNGVFVCWNRIWCCMSKSFHDCSCHAKQERHLLRPVWTTTSSSFENSYIWFVYVFCLKPCCFNRTFVRTCAHLRAINYAELVQFSSSVLLHHDTNNAQNATWKKKKVRNKKH